MFYILLASGRRAGATGSLVAHGVGFTPASQVTLQYNAGAAVGGATIGADGTIYFGAGGMGDSTLAENFFAVNPADGMVYVTDMTANRLYKIKP